MEKKRPQTRWRLCTAHICKMADERMLTDSGDENEGKDNHALFHAWDHLHLALCFFSIINIPTCFTLTVPISLFKHVKYFSIL